MKTMFLLARPALVIFLIAGIAVAEPKSKPSKKAKTYISCDDWEKHEGREGSCEIQTEKAKWELQYFTIGKAKRGLKYEVKNLVVLFRPSLSGHKAKDWYKDFFAPGEALDPKDTVVLSLAVLGDAPSKDASPELLSIDQMQQTLDMTIRKVFPRVKKVAVGGVSGGGFVAALWAAQTTLKVSHLFLSHTQIIPDEAMVARHEKAKNYLLVSELSKGPYEYLDKDAKLAFWKGFYRGRLSQQYSDAYFSSNIVYDDNGLNQPAQSLSVSEVKSLVLDSWAEFAAKIGTPKWAFAQEATLHDALLGNAKALVSHLPAKILLIADKNDQIFPMHKNDEFVALLRKNNKDVSQLEIETIRGHNSCCTPGAFPVEMKRALRDFLHD